MSEHEHERDTDATGHDTHDAEGMHEALDAISPPDDPPDFREHPSREGDAEENAGGEGKDVQSMFGGLGPAGAANARWERERQTQRNPGVAQDPRVSMAQALLKKAEKGDTKAYEAWRQVTEDMERDRLARDGADGPRAWEQIDPSHRRALLALLQGGTVEEGEGGTLIIRGAAAEDTD